MAVPCNRPYDTVPLDRSYVATSLGLTPDLVRTRLHKLKKLQGMRGAERVVICLDDGAVFEAATEDHIGSLYDP